MCCIVLYQLPAAYFLGITVQHQPYNLEEEKNETSKERIKGVYIPKLCTNTVLR